MLKDFKNHYFSRHIYYNNLKVTLHPIWCSAKGLKVASLKKIRNEKLQNKQNNIHFPVINLPAYAFYYIKFVYV